MLKILDNYYSLYLIRKIVSSGNTDLVLTFADATTETVTFGSQAARDAAIVKLDEISIVL